jgi:hypothetical protein
LILQQFDDTLILAPTFFRYEHYIDALAEILDEKWPGHPLVYFFSDNSAPQKVLYKNLIRAERAEWPMVVYNGCVEVKKLFPNVKNIFMLNEEAFPLRSVDSEKLRSVLDVCISQSLPYVYFPCYEHSWSFSTSIGNELFCITPKDYQYYTQLGPAIWDIDHLIKTCAFAIHNNILSPWKVEGIVTEEQHYISTYMWPTVADGLFKDGFVNTNALKLLGNEPSLLKRMLVKDYLMSRPIKLYRFSLRKGIGAINKLLRLLKKPLLQYPYRS